MNKLPVSVAQQKEEKMNIYEYPVSWNRGNGIQVAYAYCVAGSKAEAKRKIYERLQYKIGTIKLDDLCTVQSAAALPEKAAEIGDRVKLWYFGSGKKEHAEFF